MATISHKVTTQARLSTVRRRSSMAKRKLRLEKLERRDSMDASLGPLIGPVDWSLDEMPASTNSLSESVIVSEAPAIEIGEEVVSVDQIKNEPGHNTAFDLPSPHPHDPADAGLHAGESSENDPNGHTKINDGLLDDNFEPEKPVDGEVTGSIGLEDSSFGNLTDGTNPPREPGDTHLPIRFAPLEGPPGTLSLNQRADNARPDLTPKTSFGGDYRSTTDASVSNVAIQDIGPAQRSKVSISKTRYFAKESTGEAGQLPLVDLNHPPASLRAFANPQDSENSGISIGSYAKESRRRETFAEEQSDTIDSAIVSTQQPNDDAVGGTLQAEANDLAILQLLHATLDSVQTKVLEAGSKNDTMSVIADQRIAMTSRNSDDEGAIEPHQVNESSLVANVGRFAFLGMLVSHGFLSRAKGENSVPMKTLS